MLSLLEKKGGSVSDNQQALFNRLYTNSQNGSIAGYLSEFEIADLGTQLLVTTGVLCIQGYRIVNSDNYYIDITTTPAETIAFELIARLNVYTASESNTITLVARAVEPLVRENVFGGTNATYEYQLATFDVTTSSTIDNFDLKVTSIELSQIDLDEFKSSIEYEISEMKTELSADITQNTQDISNIVGGGTAVEIANYANIAYSDSTCTSIANQFATKANSSDIKVSTRTVTVDTPIWTTQPTISGDLNASFATYETAYYYVHILTTSTFQLMTTYNDSTTVIAQTFTLASHGFSENKIVDFKTIGTNWTMRDAGVNSIDLNFVNQEVWCLYKVNTEADNVYIKGANGKVLQPLSNGAIIPVLTMGTFYFNVDLESSRMFGANNDWANYTDIVPSKNDIKLTAPIIIYVYSNATTSYWLNGTKFKIKETNYG